MNTFKHYLKASNYSVVLCHFALFVLIQNDEMCCKQRNSTGLLLFNLEEGDPAYITLKNIQCELLLFITVFYMKTTIILIVILQRCYMYT